MGQEINTNQVRIRKFLGLNNRLSDSTIDHREAAGLENVVITEESLDQRNGSIDYAGVLFKDKTDTTTKNLTGIYQTKLNGVTYLVGTGGDAFKEYTGGAWVDRTGSEVITDNDNNHWKFSTFIDNATNEVVIASNGIDAPIKWTGSGNASTLSSPPGNFNYSVVHKNKLWVSLGDIVYFSDLLDGETWSISLDLVRYNHRGEEITGLYRYNDQVIVFQETQISMISGSSNRDLFSRTVVTGDGCAGGGSIQEVESKRYGNILIFLSKKDGRFKGFNGSPNLIDLGYPAAPLFDSMNRTRFSNAVSANYKKLGQYWCGLTYGSNSQNDQIIIYDYKNDYFTDEKGRQLSSILYHTGIKANAMGIIETANQDVLVTGNYDGGLYRQDFGSLDEGVNTIRSSWKSARIPFDSPSTIKMLADLNLVSTQKSDTNMSLSVTSATHSGTANLSIGASGDKWGELIWGTGLWSGPSTAYSRAEITRSPATEEGPIIGRYIQFQMAHSDADENMSVEEVIVGVTSLGDQPEFTE